MATGDENLTRLLASSLGLDVASTRGVIGKITSDLNKLRLVAALALFSHIRSSSGGPTYTFPVLTALFVLEALAAAKGRNKKQKVQKLLRESLSQDDKLRLLGGFMFSEVYEFKRSRESPRHLMFEDFDKDSQFKQKRCTEEEVKFCSGSSGAGESPLCYCVEWLKRNEQRTDKFLDELVARFYEMRHAVVHEAFPVMMLPDYGGREASPSFGSSVLDTYPVTTDERKFRAYEADIDPNSFFRIVRSCIRNYLVNAEEL